MLRHMTVPSDISIPPLFYTTLFRDLIRIAG